MEKALRNLDSIVFIDLGCSGALDERWSSLFPKMTLVGFDPNEAECQRLAALESPFMEAKYLPYALAGEQGEHTLYKTENKYCYSLLKPNTGWLNRFTFKDLFKVIGKTKVLCTTLNEVRASENIQPDIMKLDIQGLELPVLKSGLDMLDGLFCIETESGFTRNYVDETVFWEIAEFMESRGYIMYDINLCHMGRDVKVDFGHKQPLWCQATWLFDYVGNKKIPTKRQALVAIATACSLRFFDFAYELQEYCISNRVLTERVFEASEFSERTHTSPRSRGARVLSLLPAKVRCWLSATLAELGE